MRVIQIAKDGMFELNYMWLPTFIGQNFYVQKQLGEALDKRFGKTPGTEDEIEEWTIQWLTDKFKIPGLADYLKGLHKVMEV